MDDSGHYPEVPIEREIYMHTVSTNQRHIKYDCIQNITYNGE